MKQRMMKAAVLTGPQKIEMKCDMCKNGQEQLCRDVNGTNYIGFVCNGAYADYYVGKASNAYLLPDTVSDIDAGNFVFSNHADTGRDKGNI